MNIRYVAALLIISIIAVNCKKADAEEKTVVTTVDTVIVPKDSVVVPKTEPMVPGKSLGITSIGDRTEAVITGLGEPVSGDAAMGKSVATYKIDDNGNDATITFFSSRAMENDANLEVQMIRTNAKKFRTEGMFGVGSSYEIIEKAFGLQKVGKFVEDKNNYTLYDTNAGISFEFDKDMICHGVVIHPIDKKASTMYIPIYDNFKATSGKK